MNDLLNIENKILVIRGQQVMIDRDLAELYGVATGRLNEAVKRNIERFPDYFCFQLNQTEFENWKSQFAISNSIKMGLRKKPYAFTEQGVAMLSAVLRSETAIKVSIQIMNAFVAMRRFLLNNTKIFTEIDSIKHHLIEHDQSIDTLFTLMDRYKIDDKQGVFVQGQIFDAYTKFQELIKRAKKEIILIDNYIDLTVLDQLTAKNVGVDVIIYTQLKTPIKKLDIDKFNEQYPTLTIKYTNTMHDRFLIIDGAEIYHIGASLKDLGKKCFGFTRLEDAKLMIKTVIGAV
jgi:hypothetical protein